MLVLTLYDGEAVRIGDDIKIVMDRCIDDGRLVMFCMDTKSIDVIITY